jgi:hypothetical protein
MFNLSLSQRIRKTQKYIYLLNKFHLCDVRKHITQKHKNTKIYIHYVFKKKVVRNT